MITRLYILDLGLYEAGAASVLSAYPGFFWKPTGTIQTDEDAGGRAGLGPVPRGARSSLPNVGEAMRRRLHLVPFTTTIPTEKRDHRLTEKLWLERDGILGWMVAGCVAWQREGLSPPPSVIEAARDYFASEYLVGQWVDECCVPQGSEPSANLFQSWKAWAEAGGFSVGTQKLLGETLRAKGLRDGKVHRARGWYGISVRRDSPKGQAKP